jgi:glycosyltransferase involved in cell wall biosynthesis
MTNGQSVSSEFASDPLVTIAVPTFNRAHLVRECVHIALAQTYPNFEVLVSDNASTDATPEVLRGIDDPRLRVVRQDTNIGLIPNWNACLAQARGEYILFLPDDDRIAPWLLDRCMALVRRAPGIPIVFALGDTCVAAEGRVEPAIRNPNMTTGVYDGVDILLEYLGGRVAAQGCTILMRTESLRAAGGFPLGWPHAADLVRHLTLLLDGEAGFVNESCGAYVVHGATETHKLDVESRVDDLRRLVDLIVEAARHKVADTEKQGEIEARARHFLAVNAFGHIASTRRAGASTADVVRLIGRWRRELRHLGWRDLKRVAKPLALVVLPQVLLRPLRRGIRVLRETKSEDTGVKPVDPGAHPVRR